MEHTCIIGMLNNYDNTRLVTIFDLLEHIDDRLAYRRDCEKFNMPNNIKVYLLNDYFDKRRSTDLSHFNYCPECGKQIDWKELKKLINTIEIID